MMLRLCALTLLLIAACLRLPGQVANRSGEDSTIFISHGVFLPSFIYPSGEQNWSVATADMNGDGHPDAISVSKLDGLVNVHYNDGRGGLQQRRSFAALRDNRALCVFDANGDGGPDLATVSLSGELCVLHHDGQDGLRRVQVLTAGRMPHDVAAADLDGDGDQDLIVAVVYDHVLRIFLNQGDGQFQKGPALPAGRQPRSVQAGDLNGDGRPDLVAGADDGRLYLFLQRQDGTYGRPLSLRSTRATWALGLGDFDGDGSLDIAAGSYIDKKLCIHLNQGDGTFQREQEISSGDHNFDLVIADFDLDGDLDVATCSTVDHALNLHLNQGNGILGPRHKLKSGDWNAGIAAADFDGDGDTDLVLAAINDHSLHLHRNLAADETPEPALPVCLRGRVLSAESREAIPNAPISLVSEDGSRTIEVSSTSADGAFTFCPPVNRAYQIIVRAYGWPVHEEAFFMPDTNCEKDIFLARPQGTFVYGQVRQKGAGTPLAGAQVQLTDQQGTAIVSLTTAADGAYRYELPFANGYQAEGSLTGYSTDQQSFDLGPAHHPGGRRVDLYLEPLPEPEGVCIRGTVRDEKTGRPIPLAELQVQDSTGDVNRRIQATREGRYRLCLPFGRYEFNTTARGYFFQVSEVETVPADAGGGDITHDILLRPLEKDAHIVLKNIYYDVDKATLRPESVRELERLVQIMEDNPTLVMEIAGHTDSDASDAYNLRLSQARAQSVIDYLLAAGIDGSRMVAQGYGEQQPVAPNDSRANKQLNRRTEFKVLNWQGSVGLER